MKNINWWKVASMAMLAASAIMGFGHDLDRRPKDRGRPARHGSGRGTQAAVGKEPLIAKISNAIMEKS